MADKTTTLKTKTNDNVYPNVIGDNRKNAFVDSSTITHHFYDKTHKVGFQIANEANIKIQNSLQKPSGLTKTELVGVGANGQENIEIGDNLTLANGKLSATSGGGGSSDINYLNASFTDEENFIGTFTGSINPDKVNIIKATLYGNMHIEVGISYLYSLLNENSQLLGYVANALFIQDGVITNLNIIQELGGENRILGDNYNISQLDSNLQAQIHSHFITLDSPTLGNINFNYLTIKEQAFTIETLITYFSGKRVTCSGFINDGGTRKIAKYIDGVGDKLMVWYYDLSDGSENSIIIDNTFSISDRPTPVNN